MKKLSTMFAMAVLTTTLVAGCKKKKDEEGKEPPVATKTTEKTPDPAAKTPDPTAKTPDMAAKTPDPAATPSADLPQECKDYQAAIDSAMKCDKMAATRDAMKQGLDAMAASWKNVGALSPEVKKTMTEGCKTAAAGVATSLKAAGC